MVQIIKYFENPQISRKQNTKISSWPPRHILKSPKLSVPQPPPWCWLTQHKKFDAPYLQKKSENSIPSSLEEERVHASFLYRKLMLSFYYSRLLPKYGQIFHFLFKVSVLCTILGSTNCLYSLFKRCARWKFGLECFRLCWCRIIITKYMYCWK